MRAWLGKMVIALIRTYQFMLSPLLGQRCRFLPKLEFVLLDAIGRDGQCGTLQVDMNLPERFGIEYVDEQGQRQRSVLLHRALFGSLVRFTGILIGHPQGEALRLLETSGRQQ